MNYRTVKCSDRLPEKEGRYWIVVYNVKTSAFFNGKHFTVENPTIVEYWLEPYELPTEEGWIKLLKEFDNWQKETFPQQTVHGKVAHLEKEVRELRNALHIDKGVAEEFADCFMLVYGAAFAYGWSVDDIRTAFKNKFEINKKREWGEPNADGSVQHLP